MCVPPPHDLYDVSPFRITRGAGRERCFHGPGRDGMKVSFIIPAHNAAGFIVRSVQTIIDLFRDAVPYEIVVVENGSEDSTLQLASELADAHSEVRLLHSETGASRARNAGIRHASGDWICFVDADDAFEPDIIKAIPFLEKYVPDILVSGFRKGKRDVYCRYKVRNRPVPDEDLESAKAWMISAPTRWMASWAKFFNRDYLISNDLIFDESLTRSEDSEFLIRTLNRCRKILFTDLIVYRYNQSPSSVMRSATQGIASSYLDALRKAEHTADEGSSGVRAAYPDYVYSQIMIVAVHDFYDSAADIPWSVRNRSLALFLQEDPVRRAVAHMTFRNLFRIRNWPVLFFKIRLTGLGGAACYLRSVRNRIIWSREKAEQET